MCLSPVPNPHHHNLSVNIVWILTCRSHKGQQQMPPHLHLFLLLQPVLWHQPDEKPVCINVTGRFDLNCRLAWFRRRETGLWASPAQRNSYKGWQNHALENHTLKESKRTCIHGNGLHNVSNWSVKILIKLLVLFRRCDMWCKNANMWPPPSPPPQFSSWNNWLTCLTTYSLRC